MDVATRNKVVLRASDRCEYCRLHQDDEPYYRFHVEHITPRQHGGTDDLGNLALACHHCNLNKGPNLTAIDPDTDQIVPLFHPRKQAWGEHFFFRGSWILGSTPTGKATVRLLKMNAVPRVELRTVANFDARR